MSGGSERIVFFIDLHDDKHSVAWPTLSGSNGNLTLELFKQCVSLIVMTRSKMPVETEYSLCVLLESAVQMLEFTTDINRILLQVNELEGNHNFSFLDMSSVTSILQEAKAAQQSSKRAGSSGEPQATVRGIFLYGRSGIVPTFGGSTARAWQDVCSPDLVLDALFVHAKQTHDDNIVGRNRQSAILEFLLDLDRQRISQPYIFEHQLNPKRVLISAAQLAAYARQRPVQGDQSLLINHLSTTKTVQEPVFSNDIPMGLPV